MKPSTSAKDHLSPENNGTKPPVSDHFPDYINQLIQDCVATTSQEMQNVETPSQDTTNQETPFQETTNQETSSQETPSQETPSVVNSSQEQSNVVTSSQQSLITSSQQSVVFRGVPENDSEDLWEIIRSILQGMNLPGICHSVAAISRIGKVNPEKVRAIRVILKKEADAVALLSLSKQPRHRIRRKGVFISQYFSEAEMKEFYRKQRQKARKEKESEFLPGKVRKEGEFVPANTKKEVGFVPGKIRKEGEFVSAKIKREKQGKFGPAKKERAEKRDTSVPHNSNSENVVVEETETVIEVEEPGEVVDGHFKNVVMHRNME